MKAKSSPITQGVFVRFSSSLKELQKICNKSNLLSLGISMPRSLIVLFVSLFATTVVAETTARDAQAMLLRLGYKISVDGIWGSQSERVIGNFYAERGEAYDGILSENEVTDLSSALANFPKVAFSEILAENQNPFPNVYGPGRFCCGNFAFGNFVSRNQANIIQIQSPDRYVQELWGTPNPNYVALYRTSQKENWKDEIRLWDISSGHAVRANFKLDLSNGFCLHASELVEADFNEDGLLDVMVACSGFDGPPFRGDHSFILLSDGLGGLRSIRLPSQKGFYHGGTVFDMNSDGHVDAVLTNAASGKVIAFLNDGAGNFKKPRTILSGLVKNYTISSYDFNADGFADIIVGGHEQELNTRIYFSDVKGRFSSFRSATIPSLKNYGIVLDYLVSGKWLFIVRTRDKPQWYIGGAIQQIDLSTMQQVNVIFKSSERHVGTIRPVDARNGLPTFAAPESYRNFFDFTIDQIGNMQFLR